MAEGNAIYLNNGFYKIVNALDNAVLTATWEGNPKQVITSTWEGKDEQEWKVKCNIKAGSPYYIIRNEIIKNNLVSKEKNLSGNKNENSMVPVDWNIIPSSNSAYYLLNNGIGCLKSNGSGGVVVIEEGLEADDESHQWKFEYVKDI